MKLNRIFSILVVLVMTLGMMTVHSSAQSDIQVVLDGKTLEFDVQPQLINDRTMVPLRAIFEGMGAKVDWNGETSTVTAYKDGINVVMQIDNKNISINGKKVELDVPPMIVSSRTLVPVRAVAESFGARVLWNGDTKTVKITSARTAPFSYIYMDEALKLRVGINNAAWVSYKENGKVYLRNRYVYAKNNYVSIEGYAFDGDFAKETLNKWMEIKKTYGEDGVYKSGQEVKISGNTRGYIYPFEVTVDGQKLACNFVAWKMNNMFYVCMTSADAQAPEEVDSVLTGVIGSFSSL